MGKPDILTADSITSNNREVYLIMVLLHMIASVLIAIITYAEFTDMVPEHCSDQHVLLSAAL